MTTATAVRPSHGAAITSGPDLTVLVAGEPVSVWDLAPSHMRRVDRAEFRRALAAARRLAGTARGRAAATPGRARAAMDLYAHLSHLGGLSDLSPAPAPPDAADPGPPSPSLAAAVADLATRGGTAATADLLRGPDMLASEDFAARLGLTRQRLNEWRAAGRVLAVEGAKRGFRYPAWQVGPDGKILPGLAEAVAAFPGPFAALRFLATPLDLLGGEAPLALLRRGDAARAVPLAEAAARGDHL